MQFYALMNHIKCNLLRLNHVKCIILELVYYTYMFFNELKLTSVSC